MELSSYMREIARLSAEELEIMALEWREPDDLERLARIRRARDQLWNLERARRAGHGPESVPSGGYKLLDPAGWKRRGRIAADMLAGALPGEIERQL